MHTDIQKQLLDLSHDLGLAELGWAILGEGNTSARVNETTFLVKASGSQLRTLTEEQLVPVEFAPLVSAVDSGKEFDDSAVKALLKEAAATRSAVIPSVETLFHALLLSLPGVGFVGHTHVTSINGLLCSERGWEWIQRGRVFPDEIVVCGVAACFVPYTDPGFALARAIRDSVRRHMDRYGDRPKTIYLQSHGFIALGASPREVFSITQMADKAAKILLGAIACGSPRFLSEDVVARIAGRPDEHLRQRALGLTS